MTIAKIVILKRTSKILASFFSSALHFYPIASRIDFVTQPLSLSHDLSGFVPVCGEIKHPVDFDCVLRICDVVCHHTQRLGITERELFCKFDFYYYLCSCGLVKAFVTCRRYNSSISDNNNVMAFAFVDKKPL